MLFCISELGGGIVNEVQTGDAVILRFRWLCDSVRPPESSGFQDLRVRVSTFQYCYSLGRGFQVSPGLIPPSPLKSSMSLAIGSCLQIQGGNQGQWHILLWGSLGLP